MLDTGTLLAVCAFVSIFVSLQVTLVWRRDRRYPGMKEVRLGLTMMAAGFLIQAGRALPLPVIIVDLLIVAANTLIIGGSILAVNGTVMLAGARPNWRRDIAAAGVAGLVFLHYLMIEPSIQLRILVTGLFTAFICYGAFFSVLARRDDASHTTPLIVAGIMFLHGTSETARAFGAGYLYPVNDYVTRNPIVTFFLLEYLFSVMAVAVLSLQLVSERLQRDLQRSDSRIASAFEVASDAFAVFDGAGTLVVANPRFAEMFPDAAGQARPGVPLAEALPGGVERFGLTADWVIRGDHGFVPTAMRDRVVQLPGGAWVHVSASMTSGGGLVLRWSDITDFKQAEAVLANELARERELAAVQRSFVSMASHQFRTPLSVIDMNAHLIERLQPNMAERTGRIHRTVRGMFNLIEVMLGAASAEAGKIELQRAPQDLTLLIAEACDRIREISPNRIVELDIGGLPPTVSCDANLIDQVLGNLLTNAVKYSSKTQKVRVDGGTAGDMAIIQVTDFGVGIAPDDQPLIFERFFRAHNVGGIAGTGIGLTLARYIIDLHGGDISVRSAPGAGSTFTVRLPIA